MSNLILYYCTNVSYFFKFYPIKIVTFWGGLHRAEPLVAGARCGWGYKAAIVYLLSSKEKEVWINALWCCLRFCFYILRKTFVNAAELKERGERGPQSHMVLFCFLLGTLYSCKQEKTRGNYIWGFRSTFEFMWFH